MSSTIYRVPADTLVSVEARCREAIEQLEAAQDEVLTLVENAAPAFELPPWAADTVRMRMVQRTLTDIAGSAGDIAAGDVKLALQLVQLALDTAESSQ